MVEWTPAAWISDSRFDMNRKTNTHTTHTYTHIDGDILYFLVRKSAAADVAKLQRVQCLFILNTSKATCYLISLYIFTNPKE